MKKVLSFLFITISFLAKAQNYQCLQAGVKHYFINSNNYLRGIRIDSVMTQGDTTVYYPFHTPRGAYDPLGFPELDTNGGSWLGKRVLQLNDGTFIFDSYWNDSVIIKTQAIPGDSWVFYSDSSSLYYKATVLGMDTMTVLSSFDSVKKIMINAYNSVGLVPSDLLDSFIIILSKNHGFVRVFDLYTFPYHKVDSAYRLGLDFYLDRSTCDANRINSAPFPLFPDNPKVAIFNLTEFIIPNEQQLWNWATGDIFKIYHEYGNIPPSPCITEYYLDTVVSKIVTGHIITYTLSGINGTCAICLPAGQCNLIVKPGAYSFSDLLFPIVDTSYIPEHHPLFFSIGSEGYIFYHPDDSSYCQHSPLYTLVHPDYNNTGLGYVVEMANYKLGIGETNYYYFDGNPTYESTRVVNTGGIGCDGLLNVTVTNTVQNNTFLYPNPAKKQFIVESPDELSRIEINNILGQTVYSQECRDHKVEVNISRLSPGIYFAKVKRADGYEEIKKFVKE